MINAARLNKNYYQKIALDAESTTKAFMIVILMSIAASMGIFRPTTLSELFGSIIITILLWMLWVFMVYNLSNLFLRKAEQVRSWGSLFRTLGAAQSPGALHMIGAFISPELIAIGDSLSYFLVWIIIAWQISCSLYGINSLIEERYSIKTAAVITFGSYIPFVAIILLLTRI